MPLPGTVGRKLSDKRNQKMPGMENATMGEVLLDYQGRTDREITIKRREQVEILDETNETWWYVRHGITGIAGYIPATYVDKIRSTKDVDYASMEKVGHRFIVKYDYNRRTEQDVTIRKNQVVKLEHPYSDDWWMVFNEATGERGFVPSTYVVEYHTLEAEEWFFKNMTKANCRDTLMSDANEDGAFLVRPSEQRPNEFALSVRDGIKVRHYRILSTPERKFYINQQLAFNTLRDLVCSYIETPRGLHRRLGKPCVKNSNPPVTMGLSYNTHDKWEIPREQITLGKRLGSGHFGEVFEGKWNKFCKVAVKTFKAGNMSKEEFMAEARFLKELHHPHLLQLYAVCTTGEPVLIITEFMKNGNLRDYLKAKKKKLHLENLIAIAAQVSFGMSYLEEQNYIHRDLAARNVLVGENYQIKVADFGLSRLLKDEVYKANPECIFPVKWAAPECITHGKFSVKSDVWSFGILLYEIITFGGEPYPGMKSRAAGERVTERGYRMPQPDRCPNTLYKIMQDTWRKEPANRPAFSTLTWQLQEFFTLEEEEYKEAD